MIVCSTRTLDLGQIHFDGASSNQSNLASRGDWSREQVEVAAHERDDDEEHAQRRCDTWGECETSVSRPA
jgi:hypothetical protein